MSAGGHGPISVSVSGPASASRTQTGGASAGRIAPRLLYVTGVSGAGKSTLAAALAAAEGALFLEGDEFHPAANRARMAAGRPLDDAARAPWLAAIAARAAAERAAGRAVVIACSALRRAYRDRLRAGSGPAAHLGFLVLAAPEAALAPRLAARQGHFMPASLLPSQVASFEPPGPDEADACSLDATQPVPALLAAARAIWAAL